MGRTVGELLDSLDARELTDWMIYHSLEPFGQDRMDLPLAINTAVTAQAAGARHAKTRDFMPFHNPPTRRMTTDQIMATARRISQAIEESRRG